MKKNIFILPILAIVFSSCSKEVKEQALEIEETQQENVTSIQDYFNFMNTETDGAALIQSISTPMSSESYSAISSVKGDRAPLQLKIENHKISFDNSSRTYSTSSGKSYSNVSLDNVESVFGNTLSINIEPNSNLVFASKVDKSAKLSLSPGATSQAQSVYIPKVVKADFSGLENNSVVSGSDVSWNEDNDNKNGVVISLEYSPHYQIDESIATKNTDRILKGITTLDDGNYTFSSKDFEGLPSGAIITFYVARAGYGISSLDSGDDYSLAGMTVSRADYVIHK